MPTVLESLAEREPHIEQLIAGVLEEYPGVNVNVVILQWIDVSFSFDEQHHWGVLDSTGMSVYRDSQGLPDTDIPKAIEAMKQSIASAWWANMVKTGESNVHQPMGTPRKK